MHFKLNAIGKRFLRNIRFIQIVQIKNIFVYKLLDKNIARNELHSRKHLIIASSPCTHVIIHICVLKLNKKCDWLLVWADVVGKNILSKQYLIYIPMMYTYKYLPRRTKLYRKWKMMNLSIIILGDLCRSFWKWISLVSICFYTIPPLGIYLV